MQSHVRHLESQRQRGDGQLPGAGGNGEKEASVMCGVSVWDEEKRPGGAWW